MTKPRAQKFTGKHMAATMVIGFGIVAAVNFYMASLAVGGFHGIVVDNSYVASQKFNGWLEEAEQARALGWSAEPMREVDGTVVLQTQGVPDGAVINANLRRPIGEQELAQLRFYPETPGQYRSIEQLGDGRWTMRLSIEAYGQRWIQEFEIK